MKIEKLVINNWRSIIVEHIVFQDLMIFIGQNNHGKSNILSALLFFFGQTSADDLDYNRNGNELWVEVQFSDLSENDRTTFKKYLSSNNSIRIRKTANKETGTTYNGYLEQPSIAWLQEDNVSSYTNRETATALPLNEFLPPAGRLTKDIIRDSQLSYIQAHQNEIEYTYTMESSPFMGAKNVAKGIFGEVFFIPSVKNASDELNAKGNSLFGQLYSRVISRMSENNSVFIEAKKRIVDLSKILNRTTDDGNVNDQRPNELVLLESTLDEELKSWATRIDIQITPPNVDDIFRLGAKVWVDDGVRTDIDRKGDGLQRAMIFALLKSWAKILKEEREAAPLASEPVVAPTTSSTRRASHSSYFIFEEPELFLHPQAQRELFASLIELSKYENQVMLCTHSSSFLDMEYHKSICIVKKESIESGTKVLQCIDDIFDISEEKKRFNMIYWINPDRSELFFAKKVILVEGTTEKTVIPLIAKSINVFKYDYTVIDCGSKDTIPSYIKLLNKFNIKYVAVYDRDHQVGKNPDAINTADNSSRLIEDSKDVLFGNTVILENDIEEEIGLPTGNKNKPYIAAKYVTTEGFTLSTTFKTKVELIYS
jgi:CRISPR-associated exonuclease Cas4